MILLDNCNDQNIIVVCNSNSINDKIEIRFVIMVYLVYKMIIKITNIIITMEVF